MCDHLGIKVPQRFVVDTGSIHTTLPKARAREVEVSLETLEEYKVKLKMAGIGGTSYARILGGARLISTATDGSPVTKYVCAARDFLAL